MTDYLADVQKYDSSADEAVVNKIVRHLGIALRNKDSALVSASDPKELERVREKWCEKKLGVGGSDADAAIAATAKAMADDRSKSRVTFYYLVARIWASSRRSERGWLAMRFPVGDEPAGAELPRRRRDPAPIVFIRPCFRLFARADAVGPQRLDFLGQGVAYLCSLAKVDMPCQDPKYAPRRVGGSTGRVSFIPSAIRARNSSSERVPLSGGWFGRY